MVLEMVVDDGAPTEDHGGAEVNVEEVPAKKIPQRKTQAQRKKATRLLAEVYSFTSFIVQRLT